MRTMKRSMCVVIALCAATAVHADIVRPQVSSVKPLLLDALAHGEAHGILVGRIHDAMKQLFQTDAPIKVDIKRIGSHRQAGCARLAVRTTQADVVLPAASGMPVNPPKSMVFAYQIDYCDTGRYPEGEQGK